MGNRVQIPFNAIPENVRGRIIERRLFVCKMLSISACIVGTAVYINPVEPHVSGHYYGIFLPAFITGYIIINSSEILAMYIDEPHIFLEVCFAAIGSLANAFFSIYELCARTDWSTIFVNNFTQTTKTRNFILALASLVNSIALLLVVIIRGIQKQLSSRSLQN